MRMTPLAEASGFQHVGVSEFQVLCMSVYAHEPPRYMSIHRYIHMYIRIFDVRSLGECVEPSWMVVMPLPGKALRLRIVVL